MTLSELILLSRKRQKGLTQEALARRLGTNRATVSCWETGQRTPSLKNFAQLRMLFEWKDGQVVNVLNSMGEDNDST